MARRVLPIRNTTDYPDGEVITLARWAYRRLGGNKRLGLTYVEIGKTNKALFESRFTLSSGGVIVRLNPTLTFPQSVHVSHYKPNIDVYDHRECLIVLLAMGMSHAGSKSRYEAGNALLDSYREKRDELEVEIDRAVARDEEKAQREAEQKAYAKSYEARRAKLMARKKRWETKLKRAKTAIKKIDRQIRSMDRYQEQKADE